MLTFTELDARSGSIQDLTGLQHATNLKSLRISENALVNVSPLTELTQLTALFVYGGTVSDVSALADLTQLEKLDIYYSPISDVSALAALTRLQTLGIWGPNTVSDLTPLVNLKQLTHLWIFNTDVSDLTPLAKLENLTFLLIGASAFSDVAPLTGLTQLKTLRLLHTTLNYASLYTHIPAMQDRGVQVRFDMRTPTTLVKISGDAQQGTPGMTLAAPFVVEVLDKADTPFEGVPVTFSMIAGDGTLSATTTTTDVHGRAQTILTLGKTDDTYTVLATVMGILQSVNFSRNSSPIAIPDASLRSVVAKALEKAEGNPISEADMLTFIELDARSHNIEDLTGLQYAINLKSLRISENTLVNVSPLTELAQLTELHLYGKTTSDVSVFADLKQLTSLSLIDTAVSNLTPLANLKQLTKLNLRNNAVSDVTPLIGLTQLAELNLAENRLNYASLYTHIPAMQARGVEVRFDMRTPTTLVKISGDAQQGTPGMALSAPFVVEVLDEKSAPFEGVPVTFSSVGDGTLSATTTTTDVHGRAQTILTLGETDNTYTVVAEVMEVPQSVNFSSKNSLIAIPDANLRGRITETLGIPTYAAITEDDILELTGFTVDRDDIHDLDGLQHATKLRILTLRGNTISDVSALSGLTQLTRLWLSDNRISDISALFGLTQLTALNLSSNIISDVSPLLVLTQLTHLWLGDNPLSYPSLFTHIPDMQARGVAVTFDLRTPTSLSKISGDAQQGTPGMALTSPFVVDVLDENDTPFAGVPVTFAISVGDGTLSATTTTTDTNGRARTTLTLGTINRTYTVSVTVPEGLQTSFSASVQFAGDVNGDGVVNIQDLVFIATHLGQAGEQGADANGDDVVNIQDLVLVAGAIGEAAGAPSIYSASLEMLTATDVRQWLREAQVLGLTDVRSQSGILVLERLLAVLTPKETALLPNYPNPFNPETWIPYHLAEPMDVTLTIYSADGRLVRTLVLGYQQAGIYENKSHAAYWDGRNAVGEPVASGMYFYTLTAGDFAATGKMLIMK